MWDTIYTIQLQKNVDVNLDSLFYIAGGVCWYNHLGGKRFSIIKAESFHILRHVIFYSNTLCSWKHVEKHVSSLQEHMHIA